MDLISYYKTIKTNHSLFADVLCATKNLLFYHTSANEHKEYILSRLSKSSIDNFDIGYFPDTQNLSLLTSLVNIDDLYRLGLVYKSFVPERNYQVQRDISFFNFHNLVFPIRDVRGNVIALSGRTLLDKKIQKELNIQKYKNSMYDKSFHLYGLNFAKEAIQLNDSVIIVEGQIDTISCHQHGFYNVVGITGSTLTPWQVALLKRFTNNIFLLLDRDQAGEKETENVKKRYGEFIRIGKLTLPENIKDVAEYLKTSHNYELFDQSLVI